MNRTMFRWTQSREEELANCISHGFGFIAAVIASPFLIAAVPRTSGALFVGTVIFSVAILLLYLGSALYHAWPPTPLKYILQIVDHSAIFILIAGTYTPFALGPLRGPIGTAILILVWTLAAAGIAMKIFCGLSRPKISICLYLGMGWLILFAARPVLAALSPSTLALLVAGGLAYTGGVWFFVREDVRYNHFIWHIFVLAGTLCHFCAVFSCVA